MCVCVCVYLSSPSLLTFCALTLLLAQRGAAATNPFKSKAARLLSPLPSLSLSLEERDENACCEKRKRKTSPVSCAVVRGNERERGERGGRGVTRE